MGSIKKEIFCQVLVDFITINIATFFLFYIKFKSGVFEITYHHRYIELIVIAPVIYIFWLLIFIIRDMYKTFYFRSSIEIFLRFFGSALIGFTIIFLATLEISNLMPKGRLSFVIYALFFTVVVGSGRIFFKLFQDSLLRKGKGLRNALIIGLNKEGRKLLREHQNGNLLGLNILGFIDNDTEHAPYKGVPIIGNIDELDKIIDENRVKEMLLALDPNDHLLINEIILKAKDHKVHIKVVPSLKDIISGHVRTSELFGYPLMELFPELLTPFNAFVRRIFDLFLATILFVMMLPVMLITSIIIMLETPGGAFYLQKRVGKDFKEFTVYKFRSMVKDAEAKTGAVWATKNDARVTKVGNFIRKTRIDELPQLWNVIIGNMSFVGPRPERKVFVDQFMEEIPYYYKRLRVKPGITGWAQVKHKYDETFDDVKEKLKYDLFYIENMSLMLDIVIILNTIRVVLGQKGH